MNQLPNPSVASPPFPVKQYLFLSACKCLLITSLAAGQALAAVNRSLTYNLTVSPSQAWMDTHIDLSPGDTVQINAVADKGGCSPDGTGTSQAGTLRLHSAPRGALIGKLGENGTAFLVGSKKDLEIEQRQRLYLGVNANDRLLCSGGVVVKVQLTPASPEPTAQSKMASALQTWLTGQFGIGPPEPSTAISPGTPSAATTVVRSIQVLQPTRIPLDTELCRRVDDLPRRVNDQFNTLGDMVNFLIVSSEELLQSALQTAGWRLADRSVEEALINAVLVTSEEKDYLDMPMSTLFLFNRPQDFGYERGEAYSIVASRHHFRLWKAPFLWNGEAVWVGAGTHDVGFEKDRRNGKVTHKIDPLVDRERDYILETLERTGTITRTSYYLPTNPVYGARNATGGSYRSDGRILVIFLQ